MLQSDLCRYSVMHILLSNELLLLQNQIKKRAFKNNAPFTSCITKINNTLNDNAEDLDIVMPIYNLIKYSQNNSKTSESLWDYYREEPNSGVGDNNVNYSIKSSKSFDYKTSIKVNNNRKKYWICCLINCCVNFWRTLDISLINWEVFLTLAWSANFVLTSKVTRDAVPAQGGTPAVARVNNPTNATFKIEDTKLYVPVVSLSIQNDNKLLEQLKTGFKGTIKWNKCKSKMSNQAKNTNLSYLIDPMFTKVNRLFVISFENECDRISFSKYYTPSFEIKDCNVLIDGKSFFDTSIKNQEEAYKKILQWEEIMTTYNLLAYEYFSKH